MDAIVSIVSPKDEKPLITPEFTKINDERAETCYQYLEASYGGGLAVDLMEDLNNGYLPNVTAEWTNEC